MKLNGTLPISAGVINNKDNLLNGFEAQANSIFGLGYSETAISDSVYELPKTAVDALSRLHVDKMPKIIKETIEEVDNIFALAKSTTSASEPKERDKFEGEKSNIYYDGITKINGKKTYVTHGIQTFPDGVINEYVETYLGENDEGMQTGGWGVIKYPTGEVEIHYDEFENGKPCKGYDIVIPNDNNVVVAFQINFDSECEQIQETVYVFDGNILPEE